MTRIFKILALTMAGGFACVCVLVAVAFFLWIEVWVPQGRQAAQDGWAAIGRPMPQFEKRLKHVTENESLRALTFDLEPFGVKSLYKAREGEQNPNSINVPKQITDTVDPLNSPRADQVNLVGRDFSYLDQHAADLDRLYKGLLRRETAVWNFVPQDGMTLRVPSYLAARSISQVIWVDALNKLERGDQKGAADAVAASLKMTSNLNDQAILVSQMIRVAIDALYAPVIARLSEDPKAFKELAADVNAKREMWREAIQTETWAIQRVVSYAGMKPEDFSRFYRNASPTRKIYISFVQSLEQFDCSRFVSGAADQIRISERVRDLALSDLGAREMSQTCSRYVPILTNTPNFGSFSDVFRPNWSRSWMRLNATLLLREQAELIRSVRAQVQLGKSGNLGEIESIVIPGAKWQITGDANANSVWLKLTPIPTWTENRDIIDENFFLLPLDGSKSWKFRARPMALTARDLHSH